MKHSREPFLLDIAPRESLTCTVTSRIGVYLSHITEIHMINYGLRFLIKIMKISVLLGRDELHALSQREKFLTFKLVLR